MRYMMLIHMQENLAKPTPELMAAMGSLMEEMIRKGILLDVGGGLLPSALGAKLHLAKGKIGVTDGPFTETKEVLGGYAILKADSKPEALELGRRFLQLHADTLGTAFGATLEIRPLADTPTGCAD